MPDAHAPVATAQVEAPNGVVWTRIPSGRSTPADLLRQLAELGKDHVEREWDWWQEDRPEHERERQWTILREWENGAPDPPDEQDAEATARAYMTDFDRRMKAKEKQRARLAAKRYDEQRKHLRLAMMRAEADAAFFAHVLKAPTSAAQSDMAEQRMAKKQTAAQQMRKQLGDPEDVIDRNGFYPADRRSMNLSSHMTFFRHPTLRELHTSKQRKRFNALLAMRPIESAAMCSECQVPSQWHAYAISLCLFRGTPEPGSRAEHIARLMPGWWQRCFACTTYQMEHQWGHDALPDFDGSQWAAMLPPVLKEVFAPDPPRPREPSCGPSHWP